MTKDKKGTGIGEEMTPLELNYFVKYTSILINRAAEELSHSSVSILECARADLIGEALIDEGAVQKRLRGGFAPRLVKGGGDGS